MLYKVFRKLGLGQFMLNIFRPFAWKTENLPPVGAAHSHLQGISPDPGNSCLCKKMEQNGLGGFDLDIIIPAYNVEKYIKRCIDSVLEQQTQYRFRLVVIDDGSTDSTPGIIDSYAHDPRLLIVHQKNRGFSGARNAGLDISDAEHIMFLDSDDFLCPGALETLMGPIKAGQCSVTEGAFNTVDVQGKQLSRVSHKEGILDPREDFFGYPWGKVFHAELFNGIRLPEGYWYEDSLIAQIVYPLMQEKKLRAYGSCDSVYNYTLNPAGITATGRKKPKCLDSLWITMQLYRDRCALGLPKDQQYYEYILNMLVLTYRRCEALPEDAKKAVFVLWKDFLDREFEGFNTGEKSKTILEKAVRENSYKLYTMACRLI